MISQSPSADVAVHLALGDPRSTAGYAVTRLLEARPVLASMLRARRAAFVTFDLPEIEPARDRVDEVVLARIAVLRGRHHVVDARRRASLLWVGGAHVATAMQVRNMRVQPDGEHFLGVCGGAAAGMIFVSNVDDSVIGYQQWDRATSFVLRMLDELVGPAL